MILTSRARLAAAAIAASAFWAPTLSTPAFAQAAAPSDAPAPTVAPTAEQIAAAREVIDVSGAGESIREIVPIFLDEARNTLTRTRPEIAKDLDAAIKAVEPEFTKRKEDLMNDIAAVYAQRFSVQELSEIKAFYVSPTGKKLVENLPGVLQGSYQQTQAWSQKMSTDIISRLRQEMKKRGVEF